jgi:hypothetical protein
MPESRPGFRPTPPPPASTPSPAPRPGPIEIRGDGDSNLRFRTIPEIPAINRSSMTISIIGEPTGEYSPQTKAHLDLETDKAKAFLLALRDGDSPIVIVDSRSGFHIEFVIAEDGPTFIVSKPGQKQTSRRFNVGRSHDVNAMAAHLLADLGP